MKANSNLNRFCKVNLFNFLPVVALILALCPLSADAGEVGRSCKPIFEAQKLVRSATALNDSSSFYSSPLARPQSASHAFMTLASSRQLISQSDYRFNARGWLSPTGGLCGSVCAVNSFKSLAEYSGHRLNQSDVNLTGLVLEKARTKLGVDAREGITLAQLAALIPDLRLATGLDIEVSRHRLLNRDDFVARENELIIGSIYDKSDIYAQHAIVIFGFNGRNEVIYADPNYPSQVYTSPIAFENGAVRMVTSHSHANSMFDEAVRLRIRPTYQSAPKPSQWSDSYSSPSSRPIASKAEPSAKDISTVSALNRHRGKQINVQLTNGDKVVVNVAEAYFPDSGEARLFGTEIINGKQLPFDLPLYQISDWNLKE